MILYNGNYESVSNTHYTYTLHRYITHICDTRIDLNLCEFVCVYYKMQFNFNAFNNDMCSSVVSKIRFTENKLINYSNVASYYFLRKHQLSIHCTDAKVDDYINIYVNYKVKFRCLYVL